MGEGQLQKFVRFPFLLAEKLTIRLGCTPILSFTLARLALLIAFANEMTRLAGMDAGIRAIAQAMVAGYAGWNLLCIAGLVIFTRHELLVRPLILLIDFLICVTLIVLFRMLELPAILVCLLLFWACHERLGKTFSSIVALSFILAFLFRNHYEPLAQSYSPQMSSDYTDSASIFIGSLIALAVIGSHLYQAKVKSWDDQLQAAGGNLSAPPMEFLMEQVADFFRARAVSFIWEDIDGGTLHHCSLSAGQAVEFPPIAGSMRPLLHPRVREAAFLFASYSDRLFFRNSFGGLKFSNSPEHVDNMNEVLQFKRGASFAVNAGALRGRFFVACNHGWSPQLLAQCDFASDSVDGFFERSFFLDAWRSRTFAEARLALSGDLHDSILQTLAAMRMRLSTLLPKAHHSLPEEQLQDLKTLQDMVIAEQSRLRQLLNESKRVNGVSQNLAESLSSCAEMLSGQWNIDCRVFVDHPDVDIDRSTAIEVEFLVREAVANAVQHAAARQVTIAAALQDDALLMAFRNDSYVDQPVNGHAQIDGIQSQSLSRRLKLLGGTAYFDNINDKTLLSIRIPLKLTEKRV